MFLKISLIFLSVVLSTANGQQCTPSSIPRQCTCISNVISCDGRYLTSVPVFSSAATADILNMRNNNITALTANVFKNVNVKTINLEGNSIARIDNGAFNGVKARLTTLILKNNKLTSLSNELSHLDHISSLDVSGNPIRDGNFSNSVMKEIGDTIQEFKFGSAQLDNWPRSISHFQELHTLELDQASTRLNIIPPDAFHSFRTTINTLSIKNTNLLAVPIGVSELRNLHTFHFDHNQKVGDQGILLQSFVNAHTSLQTLSLIDDNLTMFPRVLRYLQRLQNLSMDDNPLDFVNDEAIGLLANVKILSLQNCSLDRVPGALSNLIGVTHLDLSWNKINSIERNDLEKLYYLTDLHFNGNPLSYVSNETFGDLHALMNLDLTNTKVALVPEAVQNIYQYRNHCLSNLTIFENKLDCMCELEWLKELKVKCPQMHLKGDCDTINVNLETYVRDFIPRCPIWLLKHGQSIYPYTLPRK